jgi:hypothetical protein
LHYELFKLDLILKKRNIIQDPTLELRWFKQDPILELRYFIPDLTIGLKQEKKNLEYVCGEVGEV